MPRHEPWDVRFTLAGSGGARGDCVASFASEADARAFVDLCRTISVCFAARALPQEPIDIRHEARHSAPAFDVVS